MTSIVPLEVLDQHSIALGKTGAGKSFALRSLVERLLDEKRRVCIVTPKGDWWGLKSSASGKSAGYPVVIFGGKHADVPINPRVGKEVAELVATGNRPCVIEFHGWMPVDRTRFWIDFASTLFNMNKGTLYLVIDEVHNFAPQGKVLDVEAGKSLHWTNRLASEGRGIGIRLMMASQRPQKVHKDTVTSAETLIAMRVIHKLDRDAIKEWMDGAGDPERSKLVLNSLAEMKRGEAFVWSPEIKYFEHVKFPAIKTFDSFKAPTGDDADDMPKGWASVNLEDVKKKLASAVEEAKANDPAMLKARIRELELQGKQRVVSTVTDGAALLAAERKGYEKAFHEANQLWRSSVDSWKGRVRDAIATGPAGINMEAFLPSLHIVDEVLNRRPLDAQRESARREHAAAMDAALERERLNEEVPLLTRLREKGKLPIGERKILTAVAQHPTGVERDQLTVLTGYKRSSRDAYIQRLKERGYIQIDGQAITVLIEGIQALGPDFQPLPTGSALQEHYRQNLPQGEKAIFEYLLRNGGREISRDELGEATGYKRSSRDAYLQRLKARRLVDFPHGRVVLSERILA